MKLLIAISFCFFSLSSFANVQVKNINISQSGGQANLVIQFKGDLQDDPELLVRDNMIQVALTGAVVWPKIEKKLSLNKKVLRKDTTLLAYQFNKKLVRVRALLPFSVKNKGTVDIRVKDQSIIVSFPVGIQHVTKNVKTALTKKDSTIYDESFLDRLLSEKEQSVKIKKNHKITRVSNLDVMKKTVVEDKVNNIASGLDKQLTDVGTHKSDFNIINYFGKFIAFLGVILLLFYSVVTLMRKGVLKKGKLGFLNDTNVITVLNTTYIGPKKSLLLVKVHNQTFLLSSTEKGMEFLSEVNDTTGILKQGEHDVTGANFDSALSNDENLSANIVLKEDISQSKPLEQNRGILSSLKKGKNKDQVRFSDQIKTKVKNLKPLQ